METNLNESLFYPFTVANEKCGGNYNTFGDPYNRLGVPNKVNNINVKVFYSMPEVNDTRFLVQPESCEFKYRLNESECNSKQKYRCNGCWCACKELNDCCSCKGDYMWNPSTCYC